MKKVFKMRLLAAMALVVIFAGCGGDGGASDPSLSEAAGGSGTVYGIVVNYSNKAAIEGASVSVLIHNKSEPRVVKTDKDGKFSITSVAAGQHILRVEAPNLATYEEWINMEDQKGYVAAGSNGFVYLSLICNASIYTVHNGSAVPGVTVSMVPYGNSPEQTVTSDAEGLATFANLSQVESYAVAVHPLDSDADGKYNYTASSPQSYRCIASPSMMAVSLTKADNQKSLYVVSASYMNRNSIGLQYSPSQRWVNNSITPTDKIVLVFNQPVTMPATGTVSMQYTDWLSDPAKAPPFGKIFDVGMTPVLSAGGTVLTIQPAAPLTEHMVYNINGSVETIINGYPYQDDLSSLASGSIHVTPTAKWSLGDITLDNYNGTWESDKGTSNNVYLQFPRPVKGEYIITATTDEGTSNVRANSTSTLQTTMVPDWSATNMGIGGKPCVDATCADTGAVKYIVRTPYSMKDNRAAAANNITVYINASDSDGNIVQGQVTLPVR